MRFQAVKNYVADFARNKKIIVCTYTHIVRQLCRLVIKVLQISTVPTYIINQHTFQYLIGCYIHQIYNSNVEKYILFKKKRTQIYILCFILVTMYSVILHNFFIYNYK